MVEGHTWTKRRNRVVCWSCFPYRVYIDSNRCDSRICVTACLVAAIKYLINIICLLMNYDYALL
jgi:hypothetical protein